MKGARGVLINITGGPDMMLFEVDQAANRIRAEIDSDANIIFGGTILENMEGVLRVSVVATGIEAEVNQQMPANVEPLRTYRKPSPLPTRTETKIAEAAAKPAVAVSPVRHQMEALAHEMNIASTQPERVVAIAQPAIEEEAFTIPVSVRPVQVHVQPEPEPAPKRRFGFLGRREKKPEPQRVEPAPRPLTRTTAPVQTRSSAQEAPRNPQQTVADDLFPDHKKDDQFEIPAFLRRQTN
jgi:cell division protein FtsZ